MNVLKTEISEKTTTLIQNTKNITIRMNINISKKLHKKIKQKALDEDTTITKIVIEAINEHLSK